MTTRTHERPYRLTTRVRVAITLVVATTLALLLGEVLVRLTLPMPGFWSDQPSGVLQADSTSGFIYSPGFSGRIAQTDGTVFVAINELGMREDSLAQIEPSRIILAIGDSFTAGWGIAQDEAWPAVLERQLRAAGEDVRVLNGGVSGYSLHQMRGRAVTLADRLSPELVVVGLYQAGWARLVNPYLLIGGHLVRASSSEWVRAGSGGLIVSTMHRPWMRELDFWLAEHARLPAYLYRASFAGWSGLTSLWRKPRVGTPAMATDLSGQVFEELTALSEEMEARGARLVVLLVNRQEPDGSFAPEEHEKNSAVVCFGEATGIPVVDPLPRLAEVADGDRTLRIAEQDPHWTRLAHREVGVWLATALGSGPSICSEGSVLEPGG